MIYFAFIFAELPLLRVLLLYTHEMMSLEHGFMPMKALNGFRDLNIVFNARSEVLLAYLKS